MRGYHQEDTEYGGAGKENQDRDKNSWIDNIREDMKQLHILHNCVVYLFCSFY